ncbi:MAG: flagellar hook-associated protein FlgK [Gallionellales bacterium RBG_16_57_15]|nr:MAG: flagellar hook-associated protein FlgK [Gallionellales bacterium RBG_16_57_15]
MGSNLFTSALSGMNAAQIGLATTEHNIANANTPGFTRQEVLIGSRPPQSFGGSFLGQGVDIVGVKRIYDQFLTTQVQQEQNQASYLSTYHSAMKQIDNLIADPTAGVSPAMQEFFNAVNGVANNPESVPARQTLLGGAQFVTNRFRAIDQRLTDIANGLTGQITSSVNTINTYAQQIATLNGNIKRATAASQGGQLPNDLLDQRDQVINQLNKEIKVSVQTQTDGAVSVFVGNGQALVINEQAMSLRTIQSSSDPSKVDIVYQSGNNTIPLQQNSLQGGNLGAYLAFRDQSLEPARNALGRVALGLAASINQQNQLGQDLNGVLGGNLFNTAVPRADKGALNTGTAVVSAAISDVGALTTSDYQLKFDGANYTMLRLSDNTTTNLGATLPQTVDGFTVSLTAGAAAAGDTFLIRPTANGARDIGVATSDPAKIAAAVPMRATAALTNIGSATIGSGTVNTPLPLDPNLQASVSITFDTPTTFTVTGAVPAVVGSVAYTSGADISYNGWTVQITGTPSVGDIFDITQNTNATGDNRNALLLAALQNQNLLANGTIGFQGAYGQLVGEIGAKAHELDVTSQAQTNMVAQTVAAQQAVSGVNLDEEAANLLRYQRAYQAAAKAMQIANTMFDALLSLGR